MIRYILHLLSLMILCHAVQKYKEQVEIVKITVLQTNCGIPACQHVELYYTNSWCSPSSASSNDAFFDILGNRELNFSTKAELLLSPPPPKLISIYDNTGVFILVVNEGNTKLICCEDKSARNSSDTDKRIHVQGASSSHRHYSFDLRVQTICVSGTFCTGFYCNDCEKPKIDVWTQNQTEVGETAVLHCNVSPQSGVTSIFWRKYNSATETYNNITTNNRLMGGNLSSPSLTIRNMEIDDIGNYTCLAVKGSKTASSEVVYLNVMEAETIVMAWIEQPAEIGENAVLHCNVSSTTVVRTVYWKRYNSSTQMYSNISTNVRYQVGNTSTPSLTILNVRLDDEGNYTCSVATGSRITSSEAVYLNVIEATTQISISTDVSTLESEASTSSESNLETIQHTTVSRAEQTTEVQIKLSSVHNLPNTTLSNTVSSSSILTTTILNLQTMVASETQKQNSTRTTTTVSKPALSTTKSSTTVQARDKNSQLNESSKPIIKETSANVKAWIGLTVALSVTEIILIVLVIYIIWLRKQTRSNKEKIKALSCIDTHSNRMGSNWYGETPPYRMDHLSYQGTLTSRAGDILYQEINPNEQRVSSNQDSDSHGNSVNKRQYTTEQEPLYSKINKIADPKQAITQSHTNKKRTSDTKHEDDSTNSNIIIEMSNEDINSNKQNDDLCCETQSDQNKQNLSLETNQNQVVSSNSDKHKDQKSGDMSSDILQNMQSNDIQLNSSTTNVLLPNDMTSTQQEQSTQDKTHL